MSPTLTIILILLQNLFVLTISERCRNEEIYSRCSSNPDCGCLPFVSSSDQSGMCAYLHLDSSKLKLCAETDDYCNPPYTVCVYHPNITTNRLLCYPNGMSSLDLCPLLFTISNSTTPSSIKSEDICVNASWGDLGIVIAGTNHPGTQLNQLRSPIAIWFDVKSNTLYVGDNGNDRIVAWEPNAKQGVVLAGGNGNGNRTDQFGWISDIIIDPKDESLIICDARNKRIVRLTKDGQQPEILIENLYCSGLAFDDQGLLYVSEYDKHRITRWILGENITNDGIVAGGNGKGVQLHQFNEPSAIYVDHDRNIYVADFSNDRIMKWTEGAKEGIIIGKVRWPKTIQLDQSGNVYSIDGYYNRVVRWTPNNINATIIAGEKQYSLSQPADLVFDQHGNLYVSNYGNGRVEKFIIDKSACL